MRPNVSKAILGGLIGTLAVTMMMYFVGPMMGMMKMDIAGSLTQMLGTNWTMGMLVHFVNGTLIFPLIYVFVLYGWLPGSPTVKGATWGAILWLLAQLIVMPMMGGGVFSSQMGGMMTAFSSLLGHLVYGALLGAITGSTATPAAVRRPDVRAA